MSLLVNKSYLAPKADKFASEQLNFLALNSPFTVVVNNYKSDFVGLQGLRSLAFTHNGICYHPNKNVKTRSFKGFSMVLSPNFLNGLVVFVFFNNYSNLMTFLKSAFNSGKLSYFSLLVNGHVVEKKILSAFEFSVTKEFAALKSVCGLNQNCFKSPLNLFYFSINKIYFILNAYTKSIN